MSTALLRNQIYVTNGQKTPSRGWGIKKKINRDQKKLNWGSKKN